MNAERIMEIIKKHLEQAEKDMKACGRGSNHGRVAALRSLLAELEEEKMRSLLAELEEEKK